MSPVITAFSPREDIRTLMWPGVCPGVGSSDTSPVILRSHLDQFLASRASITGRTESSIGFLKSALASYRDQWSHSALPHQIGAPGRKSMHPASSYSSIVFQPT